jgi:hypothetical protein
MRRSVIVITYVHSTQIYHLLTMKRAIFDETSAVAVAWPGPVCSFRTRGGLPPSTGHQLVREAMYVKHSFYNRWTV